MKGLRLLASIKGKRIIAFYISSRFPVIHFEKLTFSMALKCIQPFFDECKIIPVDFLLFIADILGILRFLIIINLFGTSQLYSKSIHGKFIPN